MFGINGSDFAKEMKELSDWGVKTINVRINCVGGSVVEGQSIIGQMRLLNSGNYTQVNTYVDYIAASMGGIVSLYGKKRYIAKNGIFMMHEVSGGDNDAVLKMFTDSLAMIISETTGKTIEEINNAMSKETWLSGVDAVSYGLYHDTFPALIELKESTNNVHKIYELSNKLLTKKELKMDKVVNLLKLDKDANEDIIFEAVNQVQSENKDLVQKNAELEQSLIDKDHELELLKEELAKRDALEVEAYVNKLIEDGKIKSEGKESAIKSAKADFEAFKNLTASLVSTGVHSFRNVIGDKKESTKEDWTYSDWEKKDPKGLQDMFKNDKEQYDALLNEWKQSKK